MNLRLKLRHLDKFFETKQEIVKEGVVNFLVDVDVKRRCIDSRCSWSIWVTHPSWK